MEIDELKKEYIRRILTASLCYRNYSTLYFKASFCLDEIRGIIEELKDEFNIKCVIYDDFDSERIRSFYEKNPSEKEIEAFIPKYPIPIGNIKKIYFVNDMTELDDNYFNEYANNYRSHFQMYNSELFARLDDLSRYDTTVTSLPNKEWAKWLLGSQDQLPELWQKIYSTLLDPEMEQREARERIEHKDELNRMHIRNLHFYTDLGTDFKISLNPHSIWICDPCYTRDGVACSFNYPSYEVFTSPDCYSATGKVVLAKKRIFYYGQVIDKAILNFSKGKLISCDTDSEIFESVVLRKSNKINRIGEIALVPESSPLAKSGEFYGSSFLDENTGCHLALGDSIPECIGVDYQKLAAKGLKYYHYNQSRYHIDLTFGNSSVSVEAETKDKRKILLMDRGEWKI